MAGVGTAADTDCLVGTGRFSVGFGLYPQFGADAIWWAFIAASIASMLLSVAYYQLGKWRELSVLDVSVPVAVIGHLE